MKTETTGQTTADMQALMDSIATALESRDGRGKAIQAALDIVASVPDSKARSLDAIGAEYAALEAIVSACKDLQAPLKGKLQAADPGVYGGVTVTKAPRVREVNNALLYRALKRKRPDMLPIVFHKADLKALDAMAASEKWVLRYVAESTGTRSVKVNKS